MGGESRRVGGWRAKISRLNSFYFSKSIFSYFLTSVRKFTHQHHSNGVPYMDIQVVIVKFTKKDHLPQGVMQ